MGLLAHIAIKAAAPSAAGATTEAVSDTNAPQAAGGSDTASPPRIAARGAKRSGIPHPEPPRQRRLRRVTAAGAELRDHPALDAGRRRGRLRPQGGDDQRHAEARARRVRAFLGARCAGPGRR